MFRYEKVLNALRLHIQVFKNIGNCDGHFNEFADALVKTATFEWYT